MEDADQCFSKSSFAVTMTSEILAPKAVINTRNLPTAGLTQYLYGRREADFDVVHNKANLYRTFKAVFNQFALGTSFSRVRRKWATSCNNIKYPYFTEGADKIPEGFTGWKQDIIPLPGNEMVYGSKRHCCRQPFNALPKQHIRRYVITKVPLKTKAPWYDNTLAGGHEDINH